MGIFNVLRLIQAFLEERIDLASNDFYGKIEYELNVSVCQHCSGGVARQTFRPFEPERAGSNPARSTL